MPGGMELSSGEDGSTDYPSKANRAAWTEGMIDDGTDTAGTLGLGGFHSGICTGAVGSAAGAGFVHGSGNHPDGQAARPFSGDGERLLTSSMINNYVKDGVLPRPEAKKYSRQHLAMLMMICMLKSVLTLPETHAILEGMRAGNGVEELYPVFSSIHQRAMQETAQRIGEARNQEAAALYQLAMTMALEANARRIAAARILDSLMPREDREREKEKKEEKKAKKDVRRSSSAGPSGSRMQQHCP